MPGLPPTSIIANLAISASNVPKIGPRTIKVVCDFSAGGNGDFGVDLSTNFSAGQIDGVQGAFVDNSTNNAQVILTFAGTGQIIRIPPLTQGTYPVLAASPTQFEVVCIGGNAVCNIFVLNFQTVYFQWSGQGSGAIIVSDPILDSTVSGGKINVSDSALLALLASVITGGKVNVAVSSSPITLTSRSTVTVAATSTTLMSANAARQYLLIKAPSTADLWLNPIGGVAGVGLVDCILLPAGASYYESGSEVWASLIKYFCATGALTLTAFEA